MLKIMAIIMMTVDHADRILFLQEYDLFTIMGRFAFPFFAFLVARNGLYTRHPARYISLLFLFGVLSQPIYAWALDHSWLQPLNVLFTLGLGLLAVRVWVLGYWWALPLIILPGWFVDYGIEGVAVMPVIAFTVESIRQRGAGHTVTLTGFAAVLVLSCFINSATYVPYVAAAFTLAFLTLLPQLDQIEKKMRWQSFRLFFYCYYPAHLALLGLIARYLSIP